MRRCRAIKFDQILVNALSVSTFTISTLVHSLLVTASYRYNTTGSDIFMFWI